MKTIEGYNVKIYTDNIEDCASEQIKELLSIDVFSKCKSASCPMFMQGQAASSVLREI